MNTVRSYLGRGLWVFAVSFCGLWLALQGARQTGWYRARLYERLLTGSERQQIRAAAELAVLGAEEELLSALRCELPGAREHGRRALEYLWASAAGEEAYQWRLAAHQAAQKEDYRQALALLNRLLARYPDFAEGWNHRASVHWSLGDLERSAADAERALALNPRHYGAWQGLGLCRLEQGRLAEACRCLQAALRIIPYDEPTRESLRRCEELLRALSPRAKQARGMEPI